MIRDFVRQFKQPVAIEFSKLRWRWTKVGRSTIATFASLKDSKIGQDAVLMCNGPSLNKVPFNSLRGRYVIGLNKINLLFDRTTLRPDMIVAINKYVIDQNAEFFNQTTIPLMLSSSGQGHVASRANVAFLNCAATVRFSPDPGLIVYEGWTVTYAALQIAFHMGFERIAIVGADHNFNQAGKPNEVQVSNGPDSNHFDPRYFGKGTPWQLADLEGSERAYVLARKVFEASGRKLYNCTEGGLLEVFERLPLADFLDQSTGRIPS